MNRNKNLPEHIKNAFLADPRFGFCLDESLSNEDLIVQFERIYGVSRPRTPDSSIVAMVDKVTGYADECWSVFFSVFIPFVYDCVYRRLYEAPILPEVKHG